MGVREFVFGEGPEQDITRAPTMTEAQQQALNDFLASISQGGGPQLGEGAGAPIWEAVLREMSHIGPLTQAGRDATANILRGGEPTERASELFPDLAGPILKFWEGSGVRPLTQQTLDDLMTQGPQDWENYFNKTIREPALERFNEDIAPGITNRFAPSGFYSSERLESERDARGELLTGLSRERARTGFQARESALDRALQAARTSGNLTTTEQQTGMQGMLGALSGAVNEAASMRSLYGSALRSLPGIEGAAMDALPTELLEAQLMADTSSLDTLLRGLQTQTFENIVFNDPGRSGVLSDFLRGGGASEIARFFGDGGGPSTTTGTGSSGGITTLGGANSISGTGGGISGVSVTGGPAGAGLGGTGAGTASTTGISGASVSGANAGLGGSTAAGSSAAGSSALSAFGPSAAVLAMPFIARELDSGNKGTFIEAANNIKTGKAEPAPGGTAITSAGGVTFVGGDDETLSKLRIQADKEGIITHVVHPNIISIRANPENTRKIIFRATG